MFISFRGAKKRRKERKLAMKKGKREGKIRKRKLKKEKSVTRKKYPKSLKRLREMMKQRAEARK